MYINMDDMTTQRMRSAISKVYAGEKWKVKVSSMNSSQVRAIYYSFKQRNKIS